MHIATKTVNPSKCSWHALRCDGFKSLANVPLLRFNASTVVESIQWSNARCIEAISASIDKMNHVFGFLVISLGLCHKLAGNGN
jgi:hypothetical protein